MRLALPAVTIGGVLLGRRWELAGLVDVLAAARAGRGGGVLVLGDAGIGKTTLAATLVERAAGFRIGWGRCPEVEAAPYWPWRQALEPLGAAAPLLAPAASGRTAVFADLADGLARVAAQSPVLLVVEDVHWADAASLALLQFVVALLPELPCVLLLTSRDNAVDVGPDAAQALAALPPLVARLSLSGLGIDDTADLVERVLGRVDAHLARAVYERTQGNPFFVQEIARLHAVSGGGLGPPAGVQQVLGRRLARLRQETHDCLTAAAVLGDDVEVTVLGEVADLPVEAVLEAVGEAVDARLAVLDGARFEFAHALVREVLYEGAPAGRRGRLHGRAAESLARVGSDAATVADHFDRALGYPGAEERAAEYALEAAGEAMRSAAYEQAVRWFRRAADRGIDVRLELGEAQVLAGEPAEGRAVLRELARELIERGDGERAARALLAMGGGAGGFEIGLDDGEQAVLLEQALELLGDGPVKAATLARVAIVRGFGSQDTAARELAQSAIDMASRFGDARIEAAAIAAWCDTASGPDHVAERVARARRMVSLAGPAGDRALALLARRLLVIALLEQGDFPAADQHIAAYAATAEQLRAPFYLWLVPIWRGMRALMRGELEQVDRYLVEAAELGRRAHSENAELMVFALQLGAAGAADTMPDQLARIEEAMAPYAHYPMAQNYLAYYLVRAGDRERAQQLVEQRAADGVADIPKDAEWLTSVTLLGEAGRLLGHRDAVRACARAVQPYRDLWIYDGLGAACYGPVAQYLDRFADFLGSAPAAPRASVGELRRTGAVWAIRWRDQTATVTDAKGVRDLATLLSRPRTPVHVLDLVGAPRLGSDTGPLLDDRARAAYKTRLLELSEELDEAEQFGDPARAERLRTEQDFLAHELASALGLGGRPRASGDPVERARKAVSMRIAAAVKAIDHVHPTLGRHLKASVRTGRHCVYDPEDDITWQTGPG